MTESMTLNWILLEVFTSLIDETGKTRAEIITRSGMRRNTFFAKMRGETDLTTADIERLASAFDLTPEDIMRRALSLRQHK